MKIRRKKEVDFIFSLFQFVNVVTHLMKHINFVAMTHDFCLTISSFKASNSLFRIRLSVEIVVIVYLYILQHFSQNSLSLYSTA